MGDEHPDADLPHARPQLVPPLLPSPLLPTPRPLPLHRQILWLVPGWAHIAWMHFVVPTLAPLKLSENVLALLVILVSVPAVLPLVGGLTGRVSDRLFIWGFLVPAVLYFFVVAVRLSD